MKKLICEAVAATTLAIGLSGCGDTPYETPKSSYDPAKIFDYAESAVVDPGDALVIVPVTDKNAIEAIASDIELIEHQYPAGLEDDDSPILCADSAIRIDGHIALSGAKSDKTDNDASCDTIRLDFDGLDKARSYITAMALSQEEDDPVVVMWPKNPDGSTRDTFQVCFVQDYEPSDGIVLALSDQDR